MIMAYEPSCLPGEFHRFVNRVLTVHDRRRSRRYPPPLRQALRYAAGVLYGLCVVIGKALRPGATVLTVAPAVGVVCSVGTVVIAAASTAESYWRNARLGHEVP
jgi:hypothetical protein